MTERYEVAPIVGERALWSELTVERFGGASEHVQYLRRLLNRADVGLQRLQALHPYAHDHIQKLREDIAERTR